VALIYAAVPLVVILLASALGLERLAPSRLTGVAASVLGVLVIALDSPVSGRIAAQQTLRGDLLLIGAVLSWGAYLTVSKPLIARHGALPVLSATFLVGTALHLPIALATASTWPPLSVASPSAWLGLLYLTVVVTVFGLAFQTIALKAFDASVVATLGNVAPLLTVLWGVLLFGETVTPWLWLGGALTLGGVAWTLRPIPATVLAQSDAVRLSTCEPAQRAAR
jgi:drug/metabolite transporter (DMT)-like permease